MEQAARRREPLREPRSGVAGLDRCDDPLGTGRPPWGLTQVAMEATSVYWKPIWAVLEDDFELLLVNARHVKNLCYREGTCICRPLITQRERLDDTAEAFAVQLEKDRSLRS
jgi:hypothetical protein